MTIVVDRMVLEVENLTVYNASPGGHVVVDGVGFSVARGEIVCLVGESGSGKSVTGLAVARLLPKNLVISQNSHIRLAGKDIIPLSEREMTDVRGKSVSMVFQDPLRSLNPVYTIGKQIEEGLRIRERLSKKAARRRVFALLEQVRFSDPTRVVDSYPHELSGGMRQRAVLAMALAQGPALLIADEPTTALDVTIQAEILDLFRDLCRDLGLGILLITHDIGVVNVVGDHVLVMYAGCIVEKGGKDDVLQKPLHPYTRALLDAVPRLTTSGRAEVIDIPGSVPGPGHRPLGCSFAPRCIHAMNECLSIVPVFTDAEAVGCEHTAACFLLREDRNIGKSGGEEESEDKRGRCRHHHGREPVT